MGGYNYNFTSLNSGYGSETPRETDYVRLSPLLFSGSHAFLSCDQRSRFGLSIGMFRRMCYKVVNLCKSLVLLVLNKK